MSEPDSPAPDLDAGFAVGPWQVEPWRNAIVQGSDECRLENRLMQTLVYLARNAGRVVSRERFFEVVWHGRVVNEEALSRAISLLRTALGDQASAPRFIQTIPGVGYRLIASVTANQDREISAIPAFDPKENSIAVLPFVNFSDDRGNEYFSDGITEEILNALTQVRRFKVVGRTSSFAFKDRNEDLRQIGRTLGVTHVLEGSVRKAKSKVRITAQLINAADGYHLWSETYDRELDDIFAVQDEIASSVAEALKFKLLRDEHSHMTVGGTTDTDAFKQYLQGVHFRNHGSDKEALIKATEAFERAIALDANYAQAHAGLATAWEQLITNNFMPLELVTEKIATPANRAIELEPELADSYVVLNRMLLHYRLDEAGAQEVIEKAISRNPGNVEVQIEYARINSYFCKHDEAVAAARTALDLDPISMFAYHFLGHVLYFARRYDEAIKVFRQVLELEPSYPRPHYGIAMSMFLQGQVEPALDELSLEPLSWMRHSGRAIVLGHLGRDAEAQESLDQLIEGYAENGLYQQSQVHAQWGDADSALNALNKSREIGDPGTSQVLVDPLLDPVRNDPRFEALLAHTGYRTV